ncbi:hypothetical protein BJX64DRAFT_288512 [Aspergillus heterothallicus]
MISSISKSALLLSCFLRLAICREPLIHNNGRFTFVDNIHTITVNTTRTSIPLIPRDTAEYLNCRGKCNPSAIPPADPSSADEEPSLLKREFVLPESNTAMASYLVRRVNGWERNGALPVFHYNFNPANSAQFRVLGDQPVEMVLNGLCGCTALAVVSRSAVYFAHFFEGSSFLTSDYADPATAQLFEERVIGFLETGDDLEGRWWNEDGIEITRDFPVFAEQLAHFAEDTTPGIYIMSPKLELDAAQAVGVPTTGFTAYGEGLNYDGQINRLREYLQGILPHVQPQIFEYEALDCRNKGLDGHRGKALYQYDPAAYEDDPAMSGARLIFQAYDIPNPFDGGYYHAGLVYDDAWRPGVEEDRILWDEPAQSPPVEEMLLDCAGQPYWNSEYNCYGNGTLCPILEGVRTLPCGQDCYLESMYTCFDEIKLCPVIEGEPTFPCGQDCYLPSQYRCVDAVLGQIPPDDSPGQTSVAPAPKPTTATSEWDIVLDGTTYIVGPSATTITEAAQTITLAPGSIIIGGETVWTSDSVLPSPTSIVVDDVTITLVPHTTQQPTPTSIGPTTGPTPTMSLPSSTSTSASTSTDTGIPVLPSSTVITWTATSGSSTTEITYTPTTFTDLASLTTATTITTIIDGDTETIVVGPGGVAWEPISTATSIPGFPSPPFPTVPPAATTPVPDPPVSSSTLLPPEISSSSTLPPETSSTSTFIPFPFPSPTTITTIIEGPDGPILTIITGTTNFDGVIIPITSVSPDAAVSSADALLSELSSMSAAVVAFSSNTADEPAATAATDSVHKAHSDTNDFGTSLGISGGGLWSLFGGSLSGIASGLGSLASAISSIMGGGGSSSSLTGPLGDLTGLISSLSGDIDEAIHNPPSPTNPPQPPSSTSPITTSAPCSSIVVTNCAILCATDSDPATTTCFSTTCDVETMCGGVPVTTTEIMEHVCPVSVPEDLGHATQYSYEGLTKPSFGTWSGRSTATTETTTTTTEPTTTSETLTSTDTLTTTTETITTDTTTTMTTTEPSPPPPPPEPTTEPPPTTTTDSTTTTTTTTSEEPAPTWGGRCSTYEDCPPCEDGYYRCCLSGCHGMLVPGSNTCGCVRDGEVVSPVCGCI